MAHSASLRRLQASALIIRTWHWKRRQYCSIFCTFILPGIVFILVNALNRVLRDNEKFDIKKYEREPFGAFMPRPFIPTQCALESLNLSNVEDLEDTSLSLGNLEKCSIESSSGTMAPNYDVPVYVNPLIVSEIGQRDALNQTNNSGLLKDFSLNPFVYPPAVNKSAPFFDTQTDFDGNLRHIDFQNQTDNELYENLTSFYLENKADIKHATKTNTFAQSSRGTFFEYIYDKWYDGSSLNRLFSAIAFDSYSIDSLRLSTAFTVYYNESQSFSDDSCYILCPMISTISRTYSALFSQITDGKTVTNFLKRMPKSNPYSTPGFLNLIISIVIALVTHFLLPWFVAFLVSERHSRMRDFMSSMGLPRWLYWVSTYLAFFFIYMASIAFTYIFGLVTRTSFYSLNSPGAIIILFILWGNALISFAMFLEPFFSDPQTASIASWLLLIIINFLGGPFIGQKLSDDRTTEGLWSAIMLLPSFAYMRSLYFAGAINASGEGITLQSTLVNGNQLGMCSGDGPFCRSYGFLVMDTIILLVLGAYVRFILSKLKAGNVHPLFFLGFNIQSPEVEPTVDDSAASIDKNNLGLGVDVQEEKRRAANVVANLSSYPFDGVVLHNISKTYGGKVPVHAVKSVSVVVKRGEVLALCGHNGAGKSTTFGCLVGELTPSGGDAFVCNRSVRTELDAVHEHMGLAAQQDILWFDLNVQEHLFFFGRIKGLRKPALTQEVEKSLNNVQLTNARRRRVRALSGGMKRRLSVSIAMMGDSSFVVLDEPSTGLDLLSRERLWKAIQNMKQNKAVIITTHSLEEAETLSSRVAVMSQGELKCIGTSEELKLRLGGGHRLSVSLPVSMFDLLLELLAPVAQGAFIDTVVGNNAEIALPRDASIPGVLAVIAEHKQELSIFDWAIQKPSLEDVFLKVTRFAQEQDDHESLITEP